MNDDDDTVQQGVQARENAILASIEAGLHPEFVPMDQIPADGSAALVVQRITRRAAEMGAPAGAALRGRWIEDVPPAAHGKLLLAFDGWAEDPRPLVEVPCIVEFCRGLLGTVAESYGVLRILADERQFEELTPQWYDAAGALWAVAHACPGHPIWNRHIDGRLYRDIDANVFFLNQLLKAGA